MFRKFFVSSRKNHSLRRSSPAHRSFRPWRSLPYLEELEARRTPSVNVGITNGVLTVNCTGSGNTLTVDHSSTATTVNGIQFSDTLFSSVVINNVLNDVDKIHALPPKPTAISSTGHDTANLGNTTRGMQDILGPVNSKNPPSTTVLTLDDAADPSARNVTLSASGTTSTVSGLAPGNITYVTNDVFLIISSGAGSVCNVLSTGGGVDIDGGRGNDTVNVGNPNNGGVQSIRAGVTVSHTASSGTTALNVSDAGDLTARTVSLGVTGSLNFLSGIAPVSIFFFDNVSALNVTTGQGNDIVNVQATPALTVTTLNSNGGGDTVTVGNNTNGVQDIKGPLVVKNTPSFSTLNVTDAPDVTARTVNLSVSGTTGTVGSIAPATITYATTDLHFLNVTTGHGADTVNVSSTAPNIAVTLDSSGGGDTVNVGNATNGVQSLLGLLKVNNSFGSSKLVVDDSADTTARTLGLSTNGQTGLIDGLAPAVITYSASGVNSLSLTTGKGSDSVFVDSTVANAPVTLNSSGGADMVEVGSLLNGLLGIFGPVNVTLAKRVEGDSGLTQSGVIVGTPSYMAPEQAAGRKGMVTTATDVYGLGTILYELLTGRPPFRAETPFGTLLQVKEQEPERPRTINPGVPRDLETICLKCLEKEPRRRYRSAEALAEDLERWLAGEPVQARRSGIWERAVKWARRRPAVAALVVVSAGAGLALLGGSLWYNARLQEALQAVQAREQETRDQRDAAEKHLRLAVANTQAAHATLVHYDKLIDNTLQFQGPGLASVRQELTEIATHFYEKQIRQESEVLTLEENRELTYCQLAAIKASTGSLDEAIELSQHAARLYARLAHDHPQIYPLRRNLAAAYLTLGSYYRERGQTGEAEQTFRQAREVCQDLVAEASADATYQQALASSYLSLGAIYADTEKRDQAEVAYRLALDILTQLPRDHPESVDFRLKQAAAYHNLGHLYQTARREEEARQANDRALGIYQQLAAEQPTNFNNQELLAATYTNLGTLAAAQKKLTEAAAWFERASEIRERLTRECPMHLPFAVELGGAYLNLGTNFFRENKPEAAIDWYARAIAVLRKEPRHANARERLGRAYQFRVDALIQLRRYEEALADADKGIAFVDGPNRAFFRSCRAGVMARQGAYAGATAEAAAAANQPGVDGGTLYNLACIYSMAAVAVRNDHEVPEGERAKRAEQYAAHAVELLARSHATGYLKDPGSLDNMRNDPDLDPLRSREDFKKLFPPAGPQAKPAAR
jgi:tetratricopeptide (TPR) repeat protein